VKAAYYRAADLDGLLAKAAELSAKTLVFDIEPLVAYWDNGQEALDLGVQRIFAAAVTVPGVAVVCFSTNSLRRPSALPHHASVRVVYLAAARKPLWTAPYAGFPRPGVVIGDQIATDGLLARRLGYAFLHYHPPGFRPPWGPRLLNYGGRMARPVLFRSRG
jgi:predicted HAD superfamily phosphohydrolase YqeG